MTIFYILLTIYGGLTLLAAVVGFSVCIVAGRAEMLRQRQAKRVAPLVVLEKPTPEPTGAQSQSWVMHAP